MTQNDRVDIQGFGRGHWAAVTDRTLRGAGIPSCVGASSALRRRATMAQAAADVDDLPTYEPAADTAEQGTLVTIHGRYATLSGVHASAAASGAVSYSEGDTFDSICFGRAGGGGSTPIEHNSILLIPGLLTPAECEKLIRDVERTHTSDAKKDSAIHKKQRRRMHIPALPDTTVETYDTLLRERLLPFTSRELPAVEDYIWRRSSSLRQDAARDGGRMPRMEQRSEATPLSELQFQCVHAACRVV